MLAHIFAWLFVFTVPWQNVVFIPGLGTFSRLLGIGAIGATLLHVLLAGRVRKLISFHWVAIAFFAWVLLSVFWALGVKSSVERNLNTYVQVLVMMWVIWEAAPTRARFVNLLQAYVLGAYVAAGSTIFNYVTGQGSIKNLQRFTASGFDPNDLGVLLALALPMAWYIASSSPSGFQRWLNRAYFVAGTVGILLTGSRSALVVAVVGLFAIPWTLRQVSRGVRVATVVVMVVTGILAVRFVPASLFQRLATTGTEISEGTMNNRLLIWKGGLAVVPQRALQGYGPGGWYPAVSRNLGNAAPHNTYLSILVEEGLVGLVIYLGMFWVILIRLLRLPTLERRVGFTLLATLMTALTPLGWELHKGGWLVLALLAGWSDVLAPTRAAKRVPGSVPDMLNARLAFRQMPNHQQPVDENVAR